MAEVNQTFVQSDIKAEPMEDFVTDFDITEDPHLAAFVQASQNSSGFLYQCNTCGKGFKQRQHLASHVRAAHETKKTFQCYTCQRMFSQKTHMDMHKCNNSKRGSTGNHECNVCVGKVFKNKQRLVQHKAQVHSIHDCSYCGKTLKSSKSLKNHMYSCNSVEKGFKCQRCDQFFKEPGELISHIKDSHEQKYDFECEFCGQQFGLRGSLKNHVDTVHAQEKLSKKKLAFRCTLCGLVFKAKRELTCHETLVHKHNTNSNPSKENHLEKVCTLCSKTFQTEADLSAHVQAEHAPTGETKTLRLDDLLKIQSAKCDKCDQSFTAVNDLIAHVAQAHPEVMAKSKSKDSDVQVIQDRDQGLEQFECECGKVFASLDSMNRHTCHKVFPCHICGMKFYFAEYLQRHLSSSHNITNPADDNDDDIVELPVKKIKVEPDEANVS